MDSFTLSRNWFNWCFENPEKINSNHTALYFFCIEHCNRLGGKEKFGLPTTMAKEAIGIRSYNTYIKTLNDLISFGFIKLIEKSKNQYSSNIIAISNFNKAHDKALDKALIKHNAKQGKSTMQSTDSINKQINNETNKQIEDSVIDDIKLIEAPDWKTDFNIYVSELRIAFKEILTPEYISEREKFHPYLDISKTIEKACKDYWSTEEGWKNKKKSKTQTINWKSTFNNSLTQKMNQVYKPKNSDGSSGKPQHKFQY